MKKFFLILFLLCLSVANAVFAATAAFAEKFEKGKMAIFIKPIKMKDHIEFSGENLTNCLKNHLDYYLWYRGWDYRFIQTDSITDIKRLSLQASYSRYRYLLYLETDASFKKGRIEINLKFSFIDLKSGIKIIDRQSVKGESQRNWVDIPGKSATDINFLLYEPPDYVIKRILPEALTFLPAYEREIETGRNNLPVYLVIDQKLKQDSTDYNSNMLFTALDYASKSLRDQFDIELKICGTEYIRANSLSFSHIQPLFKSLLATLPKRKDTITIGIFKPEQPERFYQAGFSDQIGLSDLARRNILIADLSPPNRSTSQWKAFLNGHSILHEIGHLLGAMHVSDLNSIMNTHTTWVSSSHFDVLNLFIIKFYRKSTRPTKGVTDYLEYLVDCINRTDYKQSDFPAFFHSYMKANKRETRDFGPSNFAKSIRYAVDGYDQLLNKNLDSAKDYFYTALVCDSTQSATYYYLSKATTGLLSEKHLRKAADLGLYKAVFELVRSKKQ